MLINHASLIYKNSFIPDLLSNDFLRFNNLIFPENRIIIDDRLRISYNMIYLSGLRMTLLTSIIDNLEKERRNKPTGRHVKITNFGNTNPLDPTYILIERGYQLYNFVVFEYRKKIIERGLP